MRSFDPGRVGSLECRAWETYYRRKWGAFLVASVGLVRAAFRMSWPRTDAARRLMRRFYQLLRTSESRRFDPARAAELEVEWRVHREHQHAAPGDPSEGLTAALRSLYAYTYSVNPAEVHHAAALRAEAMDVSDRWVEAGSDPENPLLAQERALLVRSYAALLAAVHR
ncbi:MAG: hypothetical protein H0T69_12020 [Thermoleophilaceae bacterium]|nr:hypothetical protein [Thermoleophilaceae bacterium]